MFINPKYGSTGCRVFKREVQNYKKKILNFENWCNVEVSKIEHQFSNKVILKSYQKMSVTKNVLLNWYLQ